METMSKQSEAEEKDSNHRSKVEEEDYSHTSSCLSLSLLPRPFEEEEEKGPGTHCMRMREVYGAFSSIIRRILSLPRGRTCTDNINILSIPWHPKSVKPTDWIFLKNIARKTFFALT